MEDLAILELLKNLTSNGWALQFGDPNVYGWTITVTYFVVSFLCLRAALYSRKFRQSNIGTDNTIVWFGIALILFMLGVNKQLDFQKLFTYVGGEIAKKQGWYHMRRKVQAAFVVFAALSGVLFMAVMFRRLKGMLVQNWLVFAGLGCLIAFILFRTATFYHVDYLIHKPNIFRAFNMKFVGEFGALLIVGVGAQLSLHTTKLKRNSD